MADSPKNPASPIFSRRNLIWGGGGAVAATWLASMFPTGYSPSPPELELEVIITPSPLSPETATNTLKALFAQRERLVSMHSQLLTGNQSMKGYANELINFY